MPISPTAVWEIRTTGSDANGGAFRAGATGTDFSQQDAPEVIFSDLAIGTIPTELTSVLSPFTAAHVGNVINITGGSGFSLGRFEIMTVAAGVATMDRAVGSPSTIGGAGRLGGCLATLYPLQTTMVASNKAFIKSGDYPMTSPAGLTGPATISPTHAVPPTTLSGYFATRGDLWYGSPNNANRPRFVVNGGMSNVISPTGWGWLIENLQIVAGSSTPATGISSSANCRIVNCRVAGFTTRGIVGGIGSNVYHCEVTGGLPGAVAGISINNTGTVFACHSYNNNCTGIAIAGLPVIVDSCIVTGNLGANSDGISATSGGLISRCTIHGNGRDGMRFNAMGHPWTIVHSNILSENGGYGINCTVVGNAATIAWDGNAYFQNALGALNNLNDTSVNPVNAAAPYINSRDVTLTASPFTDKATRNWTLNNTAGGGAACRGTGVTSSWPGLSLSAYPDFGAIQQQRSSGETIIPYMGF